MAEENQKFSTKPSQKEELEKSWSFKELAKFAVISALIVLPIRFYVVEPYLVRQTSMKPTFLENDYLIVEKISKRIDKIKRGDIVIFYSPIQDNKILIKRIIGMPNETVTIDGNVTKISNNQNIDSKNPSETFLEEPYVIFEDTIPNQPIKKITLKSDEYFVMGDNRPASFDSRSWGPIKKSNIIGKPLLRLYRLNAIDIWPGAPQKK